MIKDLPRRRSLQILGSLIAAPLGIPFGAIAQTTLPDNALRFLVGHAAGGGSELIARIIAPEFESRIGRRVSVANKPSGTGVPASTLLKKDLAIGAAVAFMPTTTLAPTLAGDLFPFDSLSELVPLTTAGAFQIALWTAFQPGVSTVADYIKWVKAGPPDRLRLGLSANDTYLKIYSMMIGRAFGLDLKYVPHAGTAELVAAMRAGKIAAGLSSVATLLEHNRHGGAKILMTSGRRRVAVLSDVATVVELGHPSLELDEWYGFFASSATPRHIIVEWNRQLRIVLADVDVIARLAQLGLDIESSTLEQAAERFATHLQVWKERKESFGMKSVD